MHVGGHSPPFLQGPGAHGASTTSHVAPGRERQDSERPGSPRQRSTPRARPDRGHGGHRQRVNLTSKHIWLPCVRGGGVHTVRHWDLGCVSTWLSQHPNVNKGNPWAPTGWGNGLGLTSR